METQLPHLKEHSSAPPHFSAFALARTPISATAKLLLHSSWQRDSFIHSFIYLHSSKNIIHNKMYMQDNKAAYATLTLIYCTYFFLGGLVEVGTG